MCGIIGVTGVDDPMRSLLDGLALLEYRGYDSAGVALIAEPGERAGGDREAAHQLWRVRAAVRAQSIAELERAAPARPPARAGIGHTRWATHGAPTEPNAHPHLDCTGRVAVVHNGIIENHRELAAKLDAAGHRRTSETDTEVVAHLVEDELGAGSTLAEAVRRVAAELRGDFALAVVDTADPTAIVATRNTSPLIVGRTDSVGVVASDIAAVLGTTRELYALADGEVAEVRPGEIAVVDAAGGPVEPVAIRVSWGVQAAQREGYEDFMSKEIHEQPRALADTLLGRLHPGGMTELEELTVTEDELRAIERVVVVACGSSYHAAQIGRTAIEAWARVPSTAEIASEFRYREPVLDERTLVVAISQSGETVDTYHALREAKRRGARTLVVTNVVDSLMAREADGVIYTRAGPEVGVASTKCHLAQIALFQVFALHLARVRGTLPSDEVAAIGAGIARLPGLVASALERSEAYAEVARRLAKVDDVFFLGRHIGYVIAQEGALKLKELAYVRAEAYAAGEMKHGPISLIDREAVAVVVATRGPLWEKLLANVEELRARGATVVAVADEGDEETARLADLVLEVPATDHLLSPAVSVVPLQILAYAVARARGNDVDRPRNLAKVVTVE
ncbi:MAG TPA: glutamine--fructose-6-phosphate transaminase (isomerizing) [Acidimicrobiales bacterium]|nr:glutamine--fructose-6-phosphate transaminase (isomerizing) [Acidimicrobiales bacterium]